MIYRSEVAVMIGRLAPSCGSDEIAINMVKEWGLIVSLILE